ncbi:MAG: deoxyribose-phosphate aldolase [Phycisphaerales bacterium]
MRTLSVDPVMASERAAAFTRRSIKTTSKAAALRLALSMLDLTTLEGKDSPEKVRALCRKAIRPLPDDEAVLGERLPAVAAVCVYPAMVPVARDAVAGSGVKVASVATGFPSGQYPLKIRLRDCERAIADGADEIDMVISRGAFLAGRDREVGREIEAVAEACLGRAHLKVILETGELETLDNVRRASHLAIDAMHATGLTREPGAGFIKTSTGKVQPAATMPVTLVMLEAIREHWLATGEMVGMKPAGGIRAAKQAVQYLVMVGETMGGSDAAGGSDGATERRSDGGGRGPRQADGEGRGVSPWLSPDLFRFGASSLANDLLRQIVRLKTGRYMADYDFTES